jgi:hypothetical protein
MRTPWAGSLCVAIATLLVTPVALACGDKLVALGGGASFDRIAPRQLPGSIVLYLSPGSQLHNAEETLKLRGRLERAGHKVLVVRDGANLDRALQDFGPDVVLVDWADAGGIPATEHQGRTSPAVLRVSYGRLHGDDAAAAARVDGCHVDAGKGKGRHVVDAVAELLRQRDKGLPMQCGRAS